MIVRNHNGASYGKLEDINGSIVFIPEEGWSYYTAYQLEEIARKIRIMEKATK